MAERRMFSKRVTQSARFLKMPISTQALYFHLGLNADDDGIVEAYIVINSVGATEDDLKVLEAKQFVRVLNDDLVSYILDWNENNKIRADRKVDSIYQPLLVQILPEAEIVQKQIRADIAKRRLALGKPMDGQWTANGRHRIGKDRLGEDTNISSNQLDEGDSFEAPKQPKRNKKPVEEPAEFTRFYTEYPKHEGRKPALMAWLKLDPSAELAETIISHVERRNETEWRGKDKQYIPLPATFLNQQRWTDELMPTTRRMEAADRELN